jgi:hypothetical protein
MLVTPRPGIGSSHLVETMQQVHRDAVNLRSGSGPANHQRLLAYLAWTSNAVRMLNNQISNADLNGLVLTERYKLLVGGVGTLTSTAMEAHRVVNDLVSLELDERVVAFDEAIKALLALETRWLSVGDFVLPDSSFYINYQHKLRDVDFTEVIDVAGTRVHVLVPIVIVDELDGLKEKKDQHVRWRAGHTLGLLDEVFRRPSEIGLLSGGDPGPTSLRGRVTIEMIFDPPGHVRLPIDDDEIIDRALAIQALAGREVTLLTYDTGQSTRARIAGLKAIKLVKSSEQAPI